MQIYPSLNHKAVALLAKYMATCRAVERRLCILNYHRILARPDSLLQADPDVETFRWQMELLSQCFNVLPLSTAIHMLEHGMLPPRAICITFDDGYRSVFELALPILREFRLPATIFISTAYIGDHNMWNDRILEAIRRIPPGPLNLHKYGMGNFQIEGESSRNRIAKTLTERSKYYQPELRTDLAFALEQMCSGLTSSGLMLTQSMIRDLEHSGFEIGSHTISHPILTCVSDEVAWHEISNGKKQLEKIINRPVRFFAYPNGKFGIDFDDRHIAMTKEAGFAAAFTTAMGSAKQRQDLFQIPRSGPWDSNPLTFGLRLIRWTRK